MIGDTNQRQHLAQLTVNHTKTYDEKHRLVVECELETFKIGVKSEMYSTYRVAKTWLDGLLVVLFFFCPAMPCLERIMTFTRTSLRNQRHPLSSPSGKGTASDSTPIPTEGRPASTLSWELVPRCVPLAIGITSETNYRGHTRVRHSTVPDGTCFASGKQHSQ